MKLTLSVAPVAPTIGSLEDMVTVPIVPPVNPEITASVDCACVVPALLSN